MITGKIVSYLAIKLTDYKILKLTKAKISDLWDFVYDPYETEWLLVIIPFHILKLSNKYCPFRKRLVQPRHK